MTQALNEYTASHTLVLADAGAIVEMNCPTYNIVTIPLNSSVNFPYGVASSTVITVIQFGVGITSVEAVAGVTLHILSSPEICGQFGAGMLYQRAMNEWVWCA